eukprot:gene10082-6290_t
MQRDGGGLRDIHYDCEPTSPAEGSGLYVVSVDRFFRRADAGDRRVPIRVRDADGLGLDPRRAGSLTQPPGGDRRVDFLLNVNALTQPDDDGRPTHLLPRRTTALFDG